MPKSAAGAVNRIYFVSSGPGQYNIRMESHPQMALITSRADRFNAPSDANPGPAAYQVGGIPEISFSLRETDIIKSVHSLSLTEGLMLF